MAARNRIRLKGHETFILREGWLTKGLVAVRENPKLFFYHAGADELGVGTNMARAIRYFLREGGLIEEEGREGADLTQVGNIITEYDRYLESDFSLWLFHCNLVKNAPRATSWHVFFNLLESREFGREDLFTEMKQKMMHYSGLTDISDRSLADDCMVLINMYCRQKEKDLDPEDKKVSPFAHLGLVRKSVSQYKKTQPDLNTLDPLILLYLIQNHFIEYSTDSISIDDLLSKENLPGKVLNLTRVSVNQFLDELEDMGYIAVNRTAGLDMVYKTKNYTREETALLYYKKEKKDVPVK